MNSWKSLMFVHLLYTMEEYSTLGPFLENRDLVAVNRGLVMQKLKIMICSCCGHWWWYWEIFIKKLWRSLNNKVSLPHFLMSCREGHPRDDKIEVMLSLRSLLQGQPSTKRATLCWIITILLILQRWYGSQTVAAYSKIGNTKCL